MFSNSSARRRLQCREQWSRTNTMPKVLRKRVYAVASLIGGGLYYVMHVLDINQLLSVGCGMLVIFALRLFATIYKWNLPSVKLD